MTIEDMIGLHRLLLCDRLDALQRAFEVTQKCKRKTVSCFTLMPQTSNLNFIPIASATNGPVSGQECTNLVGNCGCAHAEPKVVFASMEVTSSKELVLVCQYSPCTSCAHVIIASQRFVAVAYRILTEHDKRGRDLLVTSGIKVIQL